MDNTTPMLRQYLEIKKEHPGTILFFRLGDFYEMFNEDAVVGSRELEITLTARQKDSDNPIPMCGVPHHAAAGYISRLVRKGYRVAICEQAEAPGKGTKLVRREVVKVVTPGTAVDAQLLEASESVFLAALFGAGDTFGCAFLELSTGEFIATEHRGSESWAMACAEIERFAPREILFPASLNQLVRGSFGLLIDGSNVDDGVRTEYGSRFALTELSDSEFNSDNAYRDLLTQLGVRELTAYGLEGRPHAVSAAGACLNYVKATQRAAAEHITSISLLESADHLVLDAVTLRNLEIVDSRSDSSRRTLFGVIDETVTGMGARLLKSWLVRPSMERHEIESRHDAVEELCGPILRERVRMKLKEVFDLERLVGRLNLGTASARDLLALNRSLAQTPELIGLISDSTSAILKTLSQNIHPLPDVQNLISRSISDEPPVNITDGGTIRDGYDPQLDELRAVSRSAKQLIASFEEAERAKTGIGSLKVRFNNVFGYYIEVSKTNLERVPDTYQRKQTLANAERFTTPELKDWEQKVLGAEEKILRLEAELFQQVRGCVKAETVRLQATARAIAALDALSALSESAMRRHFVRPALHDGDELSIKDGRHPIVEAFVKSEFVPNDILLNNSTDRLLFITGPNMGGKSTILRQIALIQILAQMGGFVPAKSATLPIVDRIWTRVGAADDLSSGRSTFMVEMTETAAILHNATPRSLVLLDEIGRGTSTFDGLSIAWAVAEYIHNSEVHSAKTLFATHYHELTELVGHLPGARNYQVMATQRDGEVVFLHRLAPGKASESYGIAVAKLAGLPNSVIARARDVLARLEKYELAVLNDEGAVDSVSGPVGRAGATRVAAQLSLFAATNESVVEELLRVDTQRMSELELREFLESLKSRIL